MEYLELAKSFMGAGADGAIIAIAFAIYKVERRLYTLELSFKLMERKII